MDEEAGKQLRQGRIMLWISIVGTATFIFTMKANNAALGIVGLVASFGGAVGGIRNVARATDGNSLAMLLWVVVGFMPGFNLVPVIYYLGRAQAALKTQEPAAPVRPAARKAPPAAPRPAARPAQSPPPPRSSQPPRSQQPQSPQGARHVLSGAIASVKQAGLDGVEDGATLGAQVRLPDGTPMPRESMPVMRATQGFAVCYLVDRGSHYTWATFGELEKAGISLDQLHLIGVANLMGQANGKPGLKLLPQENFFGLVMGGQFEASLVLLDELWETNAKEHIPNGPVVAIPSRDMCAFCDAANEAGIAALRKIVARIYGDPEQLKSHLVSDKLFIRKEGRWREFTGPAKPDLAPLEFKL